MRLIDRVGALAGIGAFGFILYFEENNVLGPADPANPSSEIAKDLVAGAGSPLAGLFLHPRM